MSDRARIDRAIGVFETMLVVERSPVELDAHLARARSSVRELYGAELPDGVERRVRERASALALGRLRLTLAPSRDGALRADIDVAPVDARALFPTWERAIALRPLPIRGGLGAHKWADRSSLARGGAEREGCLALVLDGEEVLEASRANVFAVEGDALVTPPADGRLLAGIARRRTIDAARALQIELREEPLALARLRAAGESFLTGSVRGVEPVGAVGETPLARPGAIVAALAAELRRGWFEAGAARAA